MCGVTTQCGVRVSRNGECNLRIGWVIDLLTDADFAQEYPMKLYCDNQAIVHIAENQVFHEDTKHNEVDYHLIGQKIKEKIVQTRHVEIT